MTFPDLLVGPARNWYKQLPRTTRASWSDLLKAFKDEFCGESVPAPQKYYEMRRRTNEDPLDYLYRLNVQAIQAKIEYGLLHQGRSPVQQIHLSRQWTLPPQKCCGQEPVVAHWTALAVGGGTLPGPPPQCLGGGETCSYLLAA